VHIEPKHAGENENSLMQAVNDHYRLPPELLNFRLSGDLCSHAEFFRFGRSVCYGRFAKTPGQQDTHSPDLTSSTTFDGNSLILPFNPTEIIDNLRLERYASGRFGQFDRTLKSLYYWLRPFTNRTLRSYIQRFRANQWQSKRFPNWPVDTTVEDLCESLLLLSMKAKSIERIPFIWFWPHGAQSCVCMTHDVEAPAGRDFCKQLLDINDGYGIKASFQIVPEERYEVTEEFLDELRNGGCEVCVQDLNHDGRLFDERNEFRRRVFLINQYGRDYRAQGFRSAVLYRKADWYQDLAFSYDMSMPNVAHLDPQSGGCCTVMPYFIGDVLELPVTTVQDYTLFHILKEHSVGLWETQCETIIAKNGLLSFIVHPDYITEPEALVAYTDLLALLAGLRERHNLWHALPREINHWWRARSRMSLVRHGEGWKIIGDGAEHAVLAFAEIRDGRLVYQLPDAFPDAISHLPEHRRRHG